MLVGDEGNGSIMAAARSSASVRGCRRAVCGTRCRISRRHGQRRLASAAVGRACCAWQWPWSSRRGHGHPISSSSSATLGSAAAAAAAASDDRSADDGEMGARRRLSHGVREHCAGIRSPPHGATLGCLCCHTRHYGPPLDAVSCVQHVCDARPCGHAAGAAGWSMAGACSPDSGPSAAWRARVKSAV